MMENKAVERRRQCKRCAAFAPREVNLPAELVSLRDGGRWVRAACRWYMRAVRKLCVCAGRPNVSRIRPACGFDLGHIVSLIRWFSLAKPRFTAGSFLCFTFGCLTSSISAALRFRFATALPGAHGRQMEMPGEEVEEEKWLTTAQIPHTECADHFAGALATRFGYFQFWLVSGRSKYWRGAR